MLQSVAMGGMAGLDDATLVGNMEYFSFLRAEAHHPNPLPLL
jgi:hypothetical protein